MADWAGESLDEEGLVRILNPEGTRAPLIWCFNAKHEFPMLAERLGPDQPVIGLRSLNMIARFEPGRSALDARMADHLADILLARLPQQTSIIGGNCQGVPMAAQVAARWCLAGRICRDFISMEMEPAYPLPCRGNFLYGAQSTMFNPHLRGDADAATSRWQLLFGSVSEHEVPGGHGQYFTAKNVDGLAQTVRSILHRSEAGLSARSDLRLRAGGLPAAALPEQEIELHLAVDGACPAGLMVAHLWRDADSQEPKRVAAQPANVAAGQLRIPVPAAPGRWELILFPALPPEGPVAWQDHLLPVGCLQVMPAEPTA